MAAFNEFNNLSSDESEPITFEIDLDKIVQEANVYVKNKRINQNKKPIEDFPEHSDDNDIIMDTSAIKSLDNNKKRISNNSISSFDNENFSNNNQNANNNTIESFISIQNQNNNNINSSIYDQEFESQLKNNEILFQHENKISQTEVYQNNSLLEHTSQHQNSKLTFL